MEICNGLWKDCYSRHEIEVCMERSVKFLCGSEKVCLDGRRVNREYYENVGVMGSADKKTICTLDKTFAGETIKIGTDVLKV